MSSLPVHRKLDLIKALLAWRNLEWIYVTDTVVRSPGLGDVYFTIMTSLLVGKNTL